MTETNYFELTVPALAENVGLCRLVAAAFAAQWPFTVADLDEIKVAVSEAVTNAVVHAYPQGGGVVRLTGRARNGVLELVVEDRGVGIADLDAARTPRSTTDPERLGLGFAFMESLMDELVVESRVGQGTTVRLRRNIPPSPATQQGG